MTRVEKDEDREERIKMRIIVDTYSPEEQASVDHIGSRIISTSKRRISANCDQIVSKS
ncbi:hypothetical protein [Halorubellus sp. PRR65]|uniref:hypothetical protein n=1 Tax=Halorubellus sp. PRR65 TaxID=3098148 RepID=UPI002B261A21|nr:hypothetical protein [Halorubellus sp. PRR65]